MCIIDKIMSNILNSITEENEIKDFVITFNNGAIGDKVLDDEKLTISFAPGFGETCNPNE